MQMSPRRGSKSGRSFEDAGRFAKVLFEGVHGVGWRAAAISLAMDSMDLALVSTHSWACS